jgi:DNA-binding FadR family transcriptional regulator
MVVVMPGRVAQAAIDVTVRDPHSPAMDSDRPPARPARKNKAAILLAREIVREIYADKLKPGDRYYSEEQALARHGVARNTLREALRYLEFQGALEMRPGPGGGAVVDQPDWTHLASTLALLLQFANAPLREVMEARVALEPGVAELAARKGAADLPAKLDVELATMERDILDYMRFRAAYMRFWDKVSAGTGNTVLELLTPSLRRIIQIAIFVPAEESRLAMIGQLRAVRDAIAARDPAAARAATYALDEGILQRIEARHPRQMETVVAWSDVDLNP